MLYTFYGGPFDGQTRDVLPEAIKENIFTYFEVKEGEGFSLIGDIIEHTYQAINSQMHYLAENK